MFKPVILMDRDSYRPGPAPNTVAELEEIRKKFESPAQQPGGIPQVELLFLERRPR